MESQNALDTVPSSFPRRRGSFQLVTDLLRRSYGEIGICPKSITYVPRNCPVDGEVANLLRTTCYGETGVMDFGLSWGPVHGQSSVPPRSLPGSGDVSADTGTDWRRDDSWAADAGVR